MATSDISESLKKQDSKPTGEKAFRSRKLYWVLGTTALAIALLALYYSLYVSSQQAYYNERAFRLLSTMGDKLVMEVNIVGDILAASSSADEGKANDYPRQTMHGVWGPSDFVVTDVSRKKQCPTHRGTLTLSEASYPGDFRVQATYEEKAELGETPAVEKSKCPDSSSPVMVKANINLEPLLRPSLQGLSEDFFDDVWIADMRGTVWFQLNQRGSRVRSVRALLGAQTSSSWIPFPTSTTPATETKSSATDQGGGATQWGLGQFSQERDIVVAGSDYKVFIQPLSMSIMIKRPEDENVPALKAREQGKQTPRTEYQRSEIQKGEGQRLFLCGLRSAERAHAQSLALPYTALIWGILATVAAFAVSWPLLKLQFMSPKERLHGRQLFYLTFSIVLATASLSLIALNVSYAVTNGTDSQAELQKLGGSIEANMKAELRDALWTLDALATDSALLKFTSSENDWNQANFLKKYGKCFLGEGEGCLLPTKHLPYSSFRYFFLTDRNGIQQLKFTVNPVATPQVNVSRDAYFHPVMDGELSRLAKVEGGTETYDFVMQPLYSPNTGEFLVVLAAPYQLPQDADANLRKLNLSMKVLVIKFESLFNPVLPLGYGYAVVDSQGKVLFHSVSVRNLAEDFTKESQDDVALQALLAEGTSDGLSTRYLGGQKQLWVTPIGEAGDLRLTLIVFKDTKYFTTVNAAVVIVFSLLIGFYLLFFFAVILIYMYIKRDYPLQSIWPHPLLRSRYLHITVANLFLVTGFFFRYGSYDVTTALWVVAALALAAPLCAFLERSFHHGLFLADLFVIAVLFGVSGATWVIVLPLLYALIVFYPRGWQWVGRLNRRLKLDFIYTLMTASVLLILVVAPSCGFFKVSYDFVQRLFLQRTQLDLAEKIRQRDDAIEDYYVHHAKADPEAAKQFADSRQQLDWDRYDKVFLNCQPNKTRSNCQPYGRLEEKRALLPNRLERAIAELTAWFPSNPLGAELRELARGMTPPGRDWSLHSSDKKSNPFLLLSGRAEESVISPLKGWPSLDWRVRIPVVLVSVLVVIWIHFVQGRIFMCSLAGIPPLPKWRPIAGNSPQLPHDLLIIGHPKSGKSTTVKKLEGVHYFDLAQLAATGRWTVGKPSEQVIALAHFEFDIDNPKTNLKKLRLLEDLCYVQHKRIILLSTIDPMFYLSSGGPDILVPGNEKDPGAAIQTLDRWAAVLARFRKHTIDDVTKVAFKQIAAFVASHTGDPFRDFVRRVIRECDHTAQLRIMGAAILIERAPHFLRDDVVEGTFEEMVKAVRHRRSDQFYQDYAGWVIRECVAAQTSEPREATRAARYTRDLSQKALIEELLDRGDAYYRVLWSTCTRDERLMLYQLAKDGWANPNNKLAIQQLKRRGLVSKSPGLRLMNESFRHFIRDSQYSEEITSWQEEGEQSLWRSLKMSLGILGVGVAAWLLYSQQQFFNTAVAYVGAIGGALTLVFKLFSGLRGAKSQGGEQ